MNKTKKILFNALFLVSTVVLGRVLSIRTPIITIGFSFVPIMLSAILLGWKSSVFVATFGDIIGALLFPTGSYFVGFTITAFLTGLVYGLFLYRKDGFSVDKKFILKLIFSALIVTVFLNGILNTIWIIIVTKGASTIVVPVRIVKQLVMFPVKFFTIFGLVKVFEERINQLIKND